MVFKVTFTDGTVEMVNAGTALDARRSATEKFRGRIAAKVERAGLEDMAIQRTRPSYKTPNHHR